LSRLSVLIRYKARGREEGKKLTWRDGVEALWILTRLRLRSGSWPGGRRQIHAELAPDHASGAPPRQPTPP
jgi:hypothetical protein